MKCRLLFIGIFVISLAIANCQERKFDTFSITAGSDQKMTRFDVAFLANIGINGGPSTQIRYYLYFSSEEEIKAIDLIFSPHPTFGEEKKILGPYMEINGIDFNDYLEKIDEHKGEYRINAEKLFQNIIYKDKVSKDPKILKKVVIKFLFETKDVMELYYSKSSTFNFVYNDVINSITPNEVHVDIFLQSGYKAENFSISEWEETYDPQYGEYGQYSYRKQIAWNTIDRSKGQNEFFLKFSKLDVPALIERINTTEKKLDEANQNVITANKKLEEQKSRSLKIFLISFLIAVLSFFASILLNLFSSWDERDKFNIRSLTIYLRKIPTRLYLIIFLFLLFFSLIMMLVKFILSIPN